MMFIRAILQASVPISIKWGESYGENYIKWYLHSAYQYGQHCVSAQ